MKIIKFINVLLILFFLVSCETYKTASAKYTDVQNVGVTATPTIADLDISEMKVSGYARSSSKSIQDLKAEAISEALKKTKADVLVEPRYKQEVTGSQKSVEVFGYPATYKNFRTFSKSDSLILNRVVLVEGVVGEDPEPEKKKKGKIKWWEILGISAGIFVIVGALAGG